MATFRVNPEDLPRGKVLSPGWYHVTVKGYQEKAAKTDGSTNYVFEYVVDGPEEYKGVTLMRTFSEKAPGMMVPMLEACGARTNPKESNTFDLDALVGKQLQDYNNNREYEGRIRNEVSDFRLTFYADKTTPGGLATCGYDDDGVATQRWNIVENGVFVGYQTTREQAGWIREPRSRGTCYADSYASFPFQRMPNVSLAPHPQERSLDDLVAATDDGVLVAGRGSWSIDHQRLNFQFGGQTFWEIKGGKRTHMLRGVAYQANTIELWTSCDLIGGPRSWWLGGSMSDGKGEPMQTNAVSHGCPPARFRKVNILDASGRRG